MSEGRDQGDRAGPRSESCSSSGQRGETRGQSRASLRELQQLRSEGRDQGDRAGPRSESCSSSGQRGESRGTEPGLALRAAAAQVRGERPGGQSRTSLRELQQLRSEGREQGGRAGPRSESCSSSGQRGETRGTEPGLAPRAAAAHVRVERPEEQTSSRSTLNPLAIQESRHSSKDKVWMKRENIYE